ncbi:MAG: hypothetical protein JST16_09615 [Bdellovibrionales bacterium]|nr:hypothetical protein [Bdellovibrionales bacterium]
MINFIFALGFILLTPLCTFLALGMRTLDDRSRSDAEAMRFGEELSERVSNIYAGNARLRDLRTACNASLVFGPEGALAARAAATAVVQLQNIARAQIELLVLRYRRQAEVEWSPRARYVGSCDIPGDLELGETSRLAHFSDRYAGATVTAPDRWSRANWYFDRTDVRALPRK